MSFQEDLLNALSQVPLKEEPDEYLQQQQPQINRIRTLGDNLRNRINEETARAIQANNPFITEPARFIEDARGNRYREYEDSTFSSATEDTIRRFETLRPVDNALDALRYAEYRRDINRDRQALGERYHEGDQ